MFANQKPVMNAAVKAIKTIKPNFEKKQVKPYLTKLQVYDNAEPKPIMANVATALREDDNFKGSLGYNEFTGMISVMRKLPWENDPGKPCDRHWTDDDEFAMTEWMQREVGIHCPRHVVFDGVYRVAIEFKYHPVLSYLDSLVWDGARRIESWLITYLSAADTPLNRAVGLCFLVGLVAPVYKPGCKMEDMLTLEGEQGIGKSTVLRYLTEPWFTDEISDFGSKDAAMQMRGKWLIEISELDILGRADNSRIKTFLSRTTDRFRPPYGRHLIETERQCVFAGTTNEFEYNKDPTGARRYWTVRCSEISKDAVQRDRDQLLAEAVQAFKVGTKWWLDDRELVEAQRVQANERFQADPWENVIDSWLTRQSKTLTSTSEILRDALGFDKPSD